MSTRSKKTTKTTGLLEPVALPNSGAYRETASIASSDEESVESEDTVESVSFADRGVEKKDKTSWGLAPSASLKLLRDLETKGGLYFCSKVNRRVEDLCNADVSSFGGSGTKLRRSVQNRVSFLKSKSPLDYLKVLKTNGVSPATETLDHAQISREVFEAVDVNRLVVVANQTNALSKESSGRISTPAPTQRVARLPIRTQVQSAAKPFRDPHVIMSDRDQFENWPSNFTGYDYGKYPSQHESSITGCMPLFAFVFGTRSLSCCMALFYRQFVSPTTLTDLNAMVA